MVVSQESQYCLQALFHRGHFSRREGSQRPLSNVGTVQGSGLVRYHLAGLEQSVSCRYLHALDFEGRVNLGGHGQHDNHGRDISTEPIGLHDNGRPDLADLPAARRIEIRRPDFSPAHHLHHLSPDSSGQGSPGRRPSAMSSASLSRGRNSSAIAIASRRISGSLYPCLASATIVAINRSRSRRCRNSCNASRTNSDRGLCSRAWLPSPSVVPALLSIANS